MTTAVREIDIAKFMSNIWGLLENEEQEIIRINCIVKQYKKNEIIYHENEDPKYLMCLLRGKVKIYKEGIGGRNQIMRLVSPVQYFGYRAYFANEKYVTEAAAFEASTIALIPMNVIESLIMNNKDRKSVV